MGEDAKSQANVGTKCKEGHFSLQDRQQAENWRAVVLWFMYLLTLAVSCPQLTLQQPAGDGVNSDPVNS